MLNESGLRPVEFFVVVALDSQETTTPGGIILLETAKDRDKLATQEGTLIAVSPHAFTYAEGWPEGSIPEVGQRVLFKKYAGALHTRKIDGKDKDFRLLNDKDVIAIIEPESTPLSAAA